MKLSELSEKDLEKIADNRPELLVMYYPRGVEPDLPAEIEALLKEGTTDETE